MSDNDGELPNNLILLQEFKIDRSRQKRCDCYGWLKNKKLSFTFDTKNREIVCDHCGNVVDPFEVFELIAKRDAELNQHVQQLFNQAKECREYRPWLKAIKSIEQRCGGGRRIPTCPHCREGILLEELAGTHYVDKTREIEKRKFRKGETP